MSVQIATCTESEYVPGARMLGSLNVSVKMPCAPTTENVIAVMEFFEKLAPTYVPVDEALWTVTVICAVGDELVFPFAVTVSRVGDTVRLAELPPLGVPPELLPEPLPPPPPHAASNRSAARHA